MLAVLTTSPQPSCVFSKFDVLVFVDPILLSDLNGNDDGRLLTFMSNPFVFGHFLSCFFSSTSIYNGTTRFLLWCHENCPSDRKRPFRTVTVIYSTECNLISWLSFKFPALLPLGEMRGASRSLPICHFWKDSNTARWTRGRGWTDWRLTNSY